MADKNAAPAKKLDLGAARAHMLDWLTHVGAGISGPRALVKATCEQLVAVGVPLHRFNANILILHPDYFGVAHRWDAITGDVRLATGGYDIWNTSLLLDSPLEILRQGAAAVRWHIESRGETPDFPVIADYAAEGCTDYCAMKLPFSDRSNQTVSFVTRAPGGFTADHLALIDALLPTLGQLTEVQAVRYLATVLLDTYVGPRTGAEIMAGNIRRGHGRTLRAVILMSDLQGFTRLSNTLSRDALIDHLNDYFEAVGGPVQTHGGEILKFIGDAMLAIFPIEDGDPRGPCAAALAAVREGLGRLAAHNAGQAAPGSAPAEDVGDGGGNGGGNSGGAAPLACGMALHVGDVMYGNVGTAARLDFTVIGPAVNMAARLEGLTRELGEPVLVSADFAEAAGGGFRPLGRHQVKGFDAPVAVFGLPD